MSFSLTVFGPSHYWWNSWKKNGVSRVWCHQPNEHSSGGIGFCIPGLHIAFYWGRK